MANAHYKERNIDIHARLGIPLIEREIFERTQKFYETQINCDPELKDANVLSRNEAPFKMKYKMPYDILIK